jgi:hypothetical protein
VEFLIAAAQLQARSNAWDRKKQEITSGKEVLFFADNDVVKLFTNPAKIGPPGRLPNAAGYGRIFPGDSDTEATDIAALLGEHIFHRLGEGPLVQFPSHAEELGSMLETTANNATSPPNWSRPLIELMSQQTRNFISEISARSPTMISDISEILHNVSRDIDAEHWEAVAGEILEGFLAPQSANLEMTRFLQIISEATMVPIDGIPLDKLSLLRPIWIGALKGPATLGEMVDLSKSTDLWLARLEHEKSSKTRHLTKERDARALAYLEFLNQRVEAENCQACLITGDNSMWRIAARYPETNLANWLLDPRSLVIEALDDWSNVRSNGAFKVAVRGILAPFHLSDITKLSSEQRGAKRELAGQFESASPAVARIYDKSLAQWQAVKSAYLSERLVSEVSYRPLVREFIRAVVDMPRAEIEAGLQKLHEVADASVHRQWRKLELSFSQTGVSLLLAFRGARKDRRWRSRNPPTIIIDRYPETDELARILLSEGQGSENLATQLTRVGDDGQTDVEKRYLTFLVYSILAASEGRWFITKVFASRAIAIAEAASRLAEPCPVDGREALYVRAQATRYVTKVAGGLADAALDLASARKMLEVSKGETRTEIKRIRFDSEAIAIEVAHLHFKTWGATATVTVADIDMVARQLDALASEIDVYQADSGRDKRLLDTLGAYAFVNAMQLAHLSAYHVGSVHQYVGSLVMRLWDRYASQLISTNNELYRVSYLMASYVALFEFIFTGTKNKFIRELSDKRSIEDYSVMVYDKDRFQDLFNRITSKG